MKKFLTIILLLIISNFQIVFGLPKDVKFFRDLEATTSKLYKKKMGEAPAEILKEITDKENLKTWNNLSANAQNWLHDNFSVISSEDLSRQFEMLEELRTGDDIYLVLVEGFLRSVRGQDLQMQDQISLIGKSWEESETPKFEVSPEGGGKINWIWMFDVESRPRGKKHIGIDTDTRRFICYENTIGVYYPIGDSLERIRAEIVQNKNVSGNFIGGGYLDKKLGKKHGEEIIDPWQTNK